MIDFATINEKHKLYLEKIAIEPLKEFTKDALAQYGSEKRLKQANKVADIIWQKFEHLGYVTEHAHQQFVDIALSAALLHNLFYCSSSDIRSLFSYRVKLEQFAEKHQIDVGYVYEMIEAQLGENHPIPKLKPAPNSPASTFADAVWQVNSFKPRI